MFTPTARKQLRLLLTVTAVGFSIAACSSNASLPSPDGGVNVGASSELRKLVPAAQLEAAAAGQYNGILQKAVQQNLLAPNTNPQVKRLRKIAKDLTPHSARFSNRAAGWTWEVNLIRSNQTNAFCMPGGKIVFYSGILEKLQLTDDEVAVIMGHEIAHALREHARAQIAKSQITNIGAGLTSAVLGESSSSLVKTGAQLLTLKYSRDDETDADLVGLELAARAGYDPRAGVTLWQKMTTAGSGAPLEFLSTHPAGQTRIATIQKNLPSVLPLYEAAKKPKKTAQNKR